MKAEIDDTGAIILTAENSFERYALEKWEAGNWIRQPDQYRMEEAHWRGSALKLAFQRSES